MQLFHGSKNIVENPLYGYGSVFNDYGLGFYCTESNELAKEWACPEPRNGFSNKYELDPNDLRMLNLNGEGYNILNWLALLLINRHFIKRSPISVMGYDYIIENFMPDISGYDVIIGYRADDSYFTYAKDFLNNTISVRQLLAAMKAGNLGEQVVLKTEKAFSKLSFISYEIADASIYYHKRKAREEKARLEYLVNRNSAYPVYEKDLFVRDIIFQKVKNDDARIQ